MPDQQITMADVNRLCDHWGRGGDEPPKPPVFVFPRQLAIDLARELDRMAIVEFTKDADGATLVRVLQVRHPDELTDDERLGLALANGIRYVEQPELLTFRTGIDSMKPMQLVDMEVGQWQGMRFIQSPPVPILPPLSVTARDPAEHMARLRKFTRQDWRGRRG